jgi:hypothetical protein
VTPELKPAESLREPFTYTNSARAVARFPFPFAADRYSYSLNLEPAEPGAPDSVYAHWFDVDEHYLSEIEERRIVLEQDPLRCQVLPHMAQAEWDTLELLMTRYAADYPALFGFERDGDRCRWTNRPLAIEQRFTFGDATTLPLPPFEYITRQVQGDFALLDQREDDLFLDGGMITGPADWSLDFDLGMRFQELHGPVPLAHEMGIFDRALRYLLSMPVGRPARRLNWSTTIHPRLDTSTEIYPRWRNDRDLVTRENAGELVHLRVELQLLARLARSHALLFSIRTYLISLEDLSARPSWARRLRAVLATLPDELIEYKGLRPHRQHVIDWLDDHLTEEAET